MFTQLFIGFQLTKEIELHLERSQKWREDKIASPPLKETLFMEKKFIGQFTLPPLSYGLLKEKEREIKSCLQFYCPKLNLDAHKLYLFSQIFIG